MIARSQKQKETAKDAKNAKKQESQIVVFYCFNRPFPWRSWRSWRFKKELCNPPDY